MYQSEFEGWKRYQAPQSRKQGVCTLRPRLVLEQYLERQSERRSYQEDGLKTGGWKIVCSCIATISGRFRVLAKSMNAGENGLHYLK